MNRGCTPHSPCQAAALGRRENKRHGQVGLQARALLQPTLHLHLALHHCRNTLGLLGADGYDAYAPDWVGHGDSDKPANFV